MCLKVSFNSLCLFLCSVILLFFVEEISSITLMGRQPNPCPSIRLLNGIAKTRSKGRIVRFTCIEGYKIYGDKFATCNRGRWEEQDRFPICVKPSCSPVTVPKNGIKTVTYTGAVVKFYCNTGYSLKGSRTIYCDGVKWNSTVPTCQLDLSDAETSCNFEKEELCGWQHDTTHDFDWSRHEGQTPSGKVGTGPSYDHTFGQGMDGHYMYIESSGPRLEDDKARLVSPIFKPASSQDACFIFWYHMYGLSVGTLNVYMKPENKELPSLTPQFSVSGQQGNKWIRTVVRLDPTDDNFQIIVEASRGAGYLGDTAIDDVLLTNGSACLEIVTDPPPVYLPTGDDDYGLDSSQSCRTRCTSVTPPSLDVALPTRSTDAQLEKPVVVACDCDPSCVINTTTCCQDYADYCILGKTWQQPHKSPTTTSWTLTPLIAGLVGGVILMLVITAIAMFIVVRRRRVKLRRGNVADDSDVRFLTADEVLDFNMARPRGAKEDDYDDALL